MIAGGEEKRDRGGEKIKHKGGGKSDLTNPFFPTGHATTPSPQGCSEFDPTTSRDHHVHLLMPGEIESKPRASSDHKQWRYGKSISNLSSRNSVGGSIVREADMRHKVSKTV